MCTMTWWRDSDGYHVLFNRDELKTRSEAIPPTNQSTSIGTRFIAPTDPDAGGTWLITNHHGVTVALLNLWHKNPKSNLKPHSRGQLVLTLADLTSATDLSNQLDSLENLRPFTIVAIDRTSCHAFNWDGEMLSPFSPEPPLTSSSYRFTDVSESRYQTYQELEDHSATSLWSYHRGLTDKSPSAYTIRMCRDNAQTWSTSKISVTEQVSLWEYTQEFTDFKSPSKLHKSTLTHQ